MTPCLYSQNHKHTVIWTIIVISTDSLARIALDLQLGISHQDRFHRLIQSVRSLLNSDASALLRYEGASSFRWPSTA